MRSRFGGLLAGWLLLMFAFPGKAAETPDSFVDLLSQEKYEAAEKLFDKKTAAALPAVKLAELWKSLLENNGAVKQILPERRQEKRGNLKATFVPIKFEHRIVDLKIVTGPDNQIAGLWVEPHDTGAGAAVSNKFADSLQRGKFDEAYRLFDAGMAAAITRAQLQELWNSLERDNGGFKRFLQAEVLGHDLSSVITAIPVQFEKHTVELRVTANTQDQVTGLYVIPQVEYAYPDYVDLGRFTEKESKIVGDRPALDALWTIPSGAGPFPAVVLVHGSGPNDKDESVGAAKPFKDLAGGLSSRNIAVLRYEKRTKQYPGSLNAETITVQEETIDDAIAALKLAKSTPLIDPSRVFLLGHSLGGRVAPRIASQYSDLAGVVILAGPTRPDEDILTEQNDYLCEGAKDSKAYAEFKEKIACLKDPALSEKTPSAKLPFGAPAKYWLDFRRFDPVAMAKKVSMPVLILQGGRDYQVTASGDFRRWQDGLGSNKQYSLKLYPGLNHLFVDGTGKSRPAEYDKPGHVSREVIEDISQWIRRTGKN